jgi:ferredoxin
LERLLGREANLFALSGPMAVACFLLIVLSGLYLFLFYQVGSSAGYASVVSIDQSVVGRGMRALHRYSSRGLMIFSLIHFLRYLATGRFRGARWLPWVTGLFMVGLTWFIGLTGYLLVWDTRAFLAAEVLAGWLDAVGIFGQPISFSLLSPDSLKENVFLVLLYLHITLPLLGLIFGWLHLTRLARPRLLPSWGTLAGISILYLVLSIGFPLAMLPEADPFRAAVPFQVDPFYLGFVLLPRNGLPWWMTAGVVATVALAFALPWIRRKRVSVRLDRDLCIGCGFCAADCPFAAIRMESSGSERAVARLVEGRCTECAICVGACPTGGIDLVSGAGSLSAYVRAEVKKAADQGRVRAVVYCSGHRVDVESGEFGLELPCVASMPLWVPTYLARRGIAVRLSPCGQDVCLGREGSELATGRAMRRRYPFWPRKLAVELGSRLLERSPVASIAAGSLLAALVLVASLWEGPYWQGSPAVFKVAVRVEAPFLWSYVLSGSDKERLLPHMRIDQPVAGERADVVVVLGVGGSRREWVLKPVGLHRDGPTYGYFELPLHPGAYDVEFQLQPLGVGQAPIARWTGQLQLNEGEVRVLSYGVLGPELVMR